jgi:hypothetical protein
MTHDASGIGAGVMSDDGDAMPRQLDEGQLL